MILMTIITVRSSRREDGEEEIEGEVKNNNKEK